MDINVLKNGIVEKQDEIKELEARIKHQEKEIKLLNGTLLEHQSKHDQEMQ